LIRAATRPVLNKLFATWSWNTGHCPQNFETSVGSHGPIADGFDLADMPSNRFKGLFESIQLSLVNGLKQEISANAD